MRIYSFLLIAIAFAAMPACRTGTTVKLETVHENGKTMEEFEVLKGDNSVRQGVYRRYDESSNLLESASYVNGELNGQRKIYYPGGRLMILETYMMGIYHGPYMSYFESGNKNEEGSYTDNMMSGEWRFYYDLEGNPLRESVQFRENLENGPFREYHENGQLKGEGTYKDEYEDGLYREYDSMGNLVKEIMYDEGRPLAYKEYDTAGLVIKESNYMTGD